MKRNEAILLDYVIKMSYEDPAAQEALDKYDSERTGLDVSVTMLVNSLIRAGNTRLAHKFLIGAIEEAKSE